MSDCQPAEIIRKLTIMEHNKEATVHLEPALNTRRALTRRFSPKTFLVPVKVLKKKLGTFVRKLSACSNGSMSNSGSPDSPRSTSVHSVTGVTVLADDMNSFGGAPVFERESNILSVSPSKELSQQVEEALPKDDTTAPIILNDRNSVTTIEPVDEIKGLETEGSVSQKGVDDVPRRVRSKLPSEEEPPYIEPGMVSKVIAKLNSASNVEYRHESSFVKKTSLVHRSLKAACAVTKIGPPAHRFAEPKSCEAALNVLSLTQSSSASEEIETSRICDISSSGRVDRLRRLFQEEDSPSLLQYDMGGSYATRKAANSAVGNSTELKYRAQEPEVSSPRDIFLTLVDQDQLRQRVRQEA
ncbi:hypothetical protein BWQ96_07979 [Gracilariopsis chorda]|uniref:Uncharacterized protein n=1 Tax=Gracilariopsis chorda TaxID=448386 RepID=A0A2V3IMC2_9FLOR|nr:hypothetical protein BWQ96_07979 [Gracilariopsis chorda]|eukprot:PXF42260.1 hypothetical protein BWQ96_07979 [Gracilariopsis chorda]